MKFYALASIFFIVTSISFYGQSENVLYFGKSLPELNRLVRECSPRKEHPNLNKFINSLNVTQASTEDSKGIIYTNTNIILKDCGSIVNYVLTDINMALKKGLSCLNRINKYRRIDAARLANLIDPSKGKVPFTLNCGSPYKVFSETKWNYKEIARDFNTDAVGESCIFKTFPGIVMDYSNAEINQRMGHKNDGLLFHEFLHTLGYMHSDEYEADVPVDAQICCFMHDGDPNEEACVNLKNFLGNIVSSKKTSN